MNKFYCRGLLLVAAAGCFGMARFAGAETLAAATLALPPALTLQA